MSAKYAEGLGCYNFKKDGVHLIIGTVQANSNIDMIPHLWVSNSEKIWTYSYHY